MYAAPQLQVEKVFEVVSKHVKKINTAIQSANSCMIITRKIYPSPKPAETQQHALIKKWYFFLCVCIFWKEVENILPTLYFRKVKCPWWISKANLSGMCSPCQDTESWRDCWKSRQGIKQL